LALGARGGHRVEPGDRGELLLERRGHGRGHGLGARAGKTGAHRDHRVVHVREVAHRELCVAQHAEEQDAGHHQRGHDQPADEQLGDAHGAPPAGARTSTWAPGESRNWPSVITVSPGSSPPASTAISSTVRLTLTGRGVTVESGFSTYTYVPACPVATAGAGTTVARGSV